MADTLVITGPTASGKTAVAVAVAERLAGEVISMDSRQVYRGMDIGTAKPSTAERRGIPHHGFDLVDPDQRFNAGAFARFARDVMSDIRARGRIPILAGGTGFFLRALTRPMFAEPPLDEMRKEQWKRRLAGFETEELQRWAAVLDAPAAHRYRDRQRLARVIEVAVLTGRPLSWWQQQTASDVAPIDPGVFVLDLPREMLTARIEARVAAMIATGLVDEVRALLAAGYDERSPGMNATGYIELIPWIRGEYSLQQAIELIKSATRQYARRQRTWLRHQLPANAVRLDAVAPADELADRIAALWRAESM